MNYADEFYAIFQWEVEDEDLLVCESFPTRLFATPAASAKIAAQVAGPPPGKSQVVQSGAAGGLAQIRLKRGTGAYLEAPVS